jgi:hypothetical protein
VPRAARAISRDADDAVLFTEQIERFDGFLAEADDLLRRKHRSNADLRLGWQMHKQHAGRAADRAGAMAAAADIVGEEHIAAAAPVLLPVAGFDFECAGKHDAELTPRGRVPVLKEALGHLRHHRALRREYRGRSHDDGAGRGRAHRDREGQQSPFLKAFWHRYLPGRYTSRLNFVQVRPTRYGVDFKFYQAYCKPRQNMLQIFLMLITLIPVCVFQN